MSTSLKQAIENAKARVSAAFDSVVAKGGTKPSVANLAALPSAIESIPSGGGIEGYVFEGITPTETSIIYDLDKLVSVDDNYAIDVVGNYALQNSNIVTAKFRKLKAVRGTYFLTGTSLLVRAEFPELELINGTRFMQQSMVKEIYLPKLRTLIDKTFLNRCVNLETINMPMLETLQGEYLNFTDSEAKLKELHTPMLRVLVSKNLVPKGYNLILFEFGKNLSSSFNVSAWKPTNALLNTSSSLVKDGEPFANNLEKFLYNVREYIAANLQTITQGYSITFSAEVKAAILADTPTTEAFTNKGWTIA